MIDQIKLYIPFKPHFVNPTACDRDSMEFASACYRLKADFPCYVSLADMPQGEENKVRMSGGALFMSDNRNVSPDYSELYCPYESLPSGFSGMAFKIFHKGNGKRGWPYVEIKASPAKLASGHNIFGTEDIAQGIANMLHVLRSYFGCAYDEKRLNNFGSDIKLCDMLIFDPNYMEVTQLDITYSLRISNPLIMRSFLNFIKGFKDARLTPSMQFDSTVYINAASNDFNQGKIYEKGAEVENDRSLQLKRILTPEIIQLSKELLRCESSVFSRYFKEKLKVNNNVSELLRYIHKNPNFYRDAWLVTFEKVLNHCRGHTMNYCDDRDIQEKINAVHGSTRGRSVELYSLYTNIRNNGYTAAKDGYGKQGARTFRRKRDMLLECGFSKGYLENMTIAVDTKVVPILNKIVLDNFLNPAPRGYELRNLWEVA